VDLPQTAVARGEALFWTTIPGCFQCHTIDGRGGTRAPDLTEVASRAAERVGGLTAEGYMREKIKAGLSYEYQVPDFAPIMPPFETVLTDEQIDDLIAYLLGPGRGAQ
jgi:mono/diheme cytochrome c family protein